MPRKYAKIKRHELRCLVETEYGLEIKDMHEGDRGILIYTDKGTKLLKLCKREEAKLLFSASAYDYIYKRGFTNISCINKTQSGKYLINYDDRTYLLQDFTAGKVFEVRTEEDAADAAKALAEFHKASAGFVPTPGSHARVDWGKWMEKFKSYAFNIRKFKEAADLSDSKTKFDRLYAKSADIYYERMYKAYLILKNFGYLEKVQHAMKTNQLTHKEFRKHSIIKTDNDELFICSMEDCAYDIPEVDIATLFESFTGSKKVELVNSALQAYCKILPLDRKSIKIIQAFILQPKKYYKVIDRYYGKKKNYTESQLANKLERSIKKEERKDEIVNFLENYKECCS